MVISVTQAARNFADCVNRVRYQGTSFVLHKNGVPVARLVPVQSTSDAREPLAAALLDERNDAFQHEKEGAVEFTERAEQPKDSRPPALPKRPVLNW
jgi:prevent-host-death family protein